MNLVCTYVMPASTLPYFFGLRGGVGSARKQPALTVDGERAAHDSGFQVVGYDRCRHGAEVLAFCDGGRPPGRRSCRRPKSTWATSRGPASIGIATSAAVMPRSRRSRATKRSPPTRCT